MPNVRIEDLAKVIGSATAATGAALMTAGKIEVGVDYGDIASHTQRYRTGRAANSTTVTGRNPIPYDPGPAPGDQEGFYPPASRTELQQAAENTIPHDPPGADAHVLQEAGIHPEDQPYPLPFLEPRYHTFRRAREAVERAEAIIGRRADRRATRELNRSGVLR